MVLINYQNATKRDSNYSIYVYKLTNKSPYPKIRTKNKSEAILKDFYRYMHICREPTLIF